MKSGTDKYGLVENIGNKGNQFRTTVEPNFNSYFIELITLSEPFQTILVIEKTILFLQDQ